MAANKIYLDACCYIDIVQGPNKNNPNPEREEHLECCKRFLEAAVDGKITLYGSLLLAVECTHIVIDGQRSIDPKVKDSFDQIFKSGKCVIPVQPDPRIIKLAQLIAWEHEIFLKAMDALHLATVIFTPKTGPF
jgi:hypothetical protein